MNSSTLTEFIQLFSLADTAATRRMQERLGLVLTDPEAYGTQFMAELAERGIDAAISSQELRDVALIDALLSEELLWEIDWKDPATEIALCLNELLTHQGRPERLAEPARAHQAATGPEALDIIQDLLEPLGLALVLFTLDSDSYPLGVVSEMQAEDARRWAKELGFELAVY